jgi:hypothetical protein
MGMVEVCQRNDHVETDCGMRKRVECKMGCKKQQQVTFALPPREDPKTYSKHHFFELFEILPHTHGAHSAGSPAGGSSGESVLTNQLTIISSIKNPIHLIYLQ